MKILITGGFGQLGSALEESLSSKNEIYKTGKSIPKGEVGIELNIQNIVYLKEVLNTIEPDIIINLAAMTNVDDCESHPELAKQINAESVQNLVNCFNGKIIQLSTDYVFDGNNGPYSEDDIPNPISIYGATKLISEKIILNNTNNLVIRGNVLYDHSLNNKASFLTWVVDSLLNKKMIRVVNDQFNNPTWTKSIADVIQLCIIEDTKGLYHWADEDYLSRFDFALKIAKKFNLDISLIEPITTDELDQLALRPLNGGLNQNKIKKELKLVPPSIDNCLDAIIDRGVI